jgi:hypothetical protein
LIPGGCPTNRIDVTAIRNVKQCSLAHAKSDFVDPDQLGPGGEIVSYGQGGTTTVASRYGVRQDGLLRRSECHKAERGEIITAWIGVDWFPQGATTACLLQRLN